MTRHGYETLQEELRRLKSEDRLRAVEAIKVARAHGDLSENAEYDVSRSDEGWDGVQRASTPHGHLSLR